MEKQTPGRAAGGQRESRYTDDPEPRTVKPGTGIGQPE